MQKDDFDKGAFKNK